MALNLIIGNKNYSSWSLRPWLLMTELGIAFEETRLRFDFTEGSPFRQAVARLSPAGKVPVLVDSGFAVWDTLAITEYLHDRFPALNVWPQAPQSRARARSLCAEMHSGFGALRNHCPMNLEASLPEVGARLMKEQDDLRRDLARIDQMWSEQLRSDGGPMLFGAFSATDAYFAPVCTRIRTYALPVSAAVGGYVDRVYALAGFQRWLAEALAEKDFLDFDEPYRKGPGTAHHGAAA